MITIAKKTPDLARDFCGDIFLLRFAAVIVPRPPPPSFLHHI
jgi:hypothetical protein